MHYDIDRAALSAPALDDLLAARVREDRTPSVAYALVADGRVVHAGGFANEAVTPTPGPDTAFRIASCTKSFTAVAMLQLRDAGLLDLDAPVSEYLPLTTIPDAAPTVAHLASMAAGFPTDDPWGDRQESLPLDVLDALAAAGFRLIDTPGARFEYSNLGYALLGRVLARVSGRRYLDLVREDVLEPLGLTGLGYDRTSRRPAASPPASRGSAAGGRRSRSRSPGAFSPIGGLFATPNALARWVAWLAAAWRPDADDAVLSAASRRDAQTARIPIEGGGSYGFGLFLDEHPRHGLLVSHSGGYPGYGAHMRWHAASGIGIVVLENGRYSGATVPATKGLELVLDQVAVPDALPDLWPETVGRSRDRRAAAARMGRRGGGCAVRGEHRARRVDRAPPRADRRPDRPRRHRRGDARACARGRRAGQPHARAPRVDGAGRDGGAPLRDPADARAAADRADAGRAPRLTGRLSPRQPAEERDGDAEELLGRLELRRVAEPGQRHRMRVRHGRRHRVEVAVRQHGVPVAPDDERRRARGGERLEDLAPPLGADAVQAPRSRMTSR